jgi:hypothetical protein
MTSNSSIHQPRNRNSDFQERWTLKYGMIEGDISFAESSAYAQPLMSNKTLKATKTDSQHGRGT